MIVKKNEFGKCSLCGKECKLTFEHIPPRSAFNNTPIKPVNGIDVLKDNGRMPWDISGLKYENQQKGFGLYSLCQQCNNTTGRLYGNSYADLSQKISLVLNKVNAGEKISLSLENILPLNIIKQVCSVFCSINTCVEEIYDISDLKQFVLDKNNNTLNKKKYRIQMLVLSGNISRFNNFMEYVDLINPEKSITISEIISYPVSFQLIYNPKNNVDYNGVDITFFSDYKYNQTDSITLDTLVYECNNVVINDFRTKSEIVNDMKKSIEKANPNK